jgi:hypothetical protein
LFPSYIKETETSKYHLNVRGESLPMECWHCCRQETDGKGPTFYRSGADNKVKSLQTLVSGVEKNKTGATIAIIINMMKWWAVCRKTEVTLT